MLTLHEAITYPKWRFEGDKLPTEDGGWLLHQDYGSRILAVAHLDWVGESPRSRRQPRFDFASERVWHPALDDRLGVWALHFLRDCGLSFDLLLTDNEEHGRSTACDFIPPRQYHWVFSLDRAGTDCVLYQYKDSPDWLQVCGEGFGQLGFGSYSCIADLNHLRCPALNLGIGYYDHNGPHCWADLTHARAQMSKLVAFHHEHSSTPFHWDPSWETLSLDRDREEIGLGDFNGFEDWGTCELCGAIDWVSRDLLCEDCSDYWHDCVSSPANAPRC